jgi:hypothetical protein
LRWLWLDGSRAPRARLDRHPALVQNIAVDGATNLPNSAPNPPPRGWDARISARV